MGSDSRWQKRIWRRTTNDRTIKYANSPATSRFMAPRSSHGRRRHTRTSNARPHRKGGFSERLNPSAWVRAVHKFNSVIVTTRFRSMHIPVSIRTSNAMADIKALVDSGATDCFMSERFIRRMKLGKKPLQKPWKIWNIDNTANQAGRITHYITLDIQTGEIQKTIQFLVTNIGNKDIILGYPWMAVFEPQFTWKNGVIHEKELPIILWSVNPFIPGKNLIIAWIKDNCRVQATTSTELAIKAQQYTKKVEVPAEYRQFAKVFSEEESKWYPPKRAWDHAIEFKKDAPEAVDCKVYPMNQIEDEVVQTFLHNELEKGYICESKLPYASSFFFVRKKDGKMRPVQDYCKINAITIQNQYPLPLIADLIWDLSNAHIYTKLDVRWGYNNVWICEGDEKCYDSDTFHLFLTYLTHYAYVPKPPWFSLTRTHDSYAYWSFHVTSLPTSPWRTLTYLIRHHDSYWLGLRHMFVQHKHRVLLYKP